MSALDMSCSESLTTVASSAPLPIPMRISSPEQTMKCFPGHLSLWTNDSFQCRDLTEEGAKIAITTINSWGFPLSPTSVQNVLAATPNLSPDQFRTIINRLTNTIRIRDNVHREKVEGLKADIAVPQQQVNDDNDGDGLTKCPPGYEENNGHLPNFTIPLDDGTEQFACFIKQLDDGRAAGLHSQAKGEEDTRIIELYASPNYASDKPLEPLPTWLCRRLWGDRATYAILKDAVNNLDDWGLLADVHRYRQFNQDNAYLVQKLELLKAEQESVVKNWALIEDCLIHAQLSKKVKHLALCSPSGTIQSAWKRRSPLKSPQLFHA